MSKNKTFDNSLKVIAKSSVIVLVAIVLSKVFSYIYRVVIATNFGPEIYGLYSLAIMLVGWFSIIALFGLGEGILRYISGFRGREENEKIKYIFRKSFIFLLITSIIGGSILFFASTYISNNIFNEPGLSLFLKLFSIVIPLSVGSSLIWSTLRAYEKIGWNMLLSHVLITFLNVTFLLLFIFAGLDLISIPLSYLFGSFAVFIISILVLRKQVPEIFTKPKVKRKPGIFREVLVFSWPLLFAGLIQRIFEWADLFFIGYYKMAIDVGIYNAAIPIAFLLFVSSEIFMKLFYPIINKEYSKGSKGGKETVKQLSQQIGKWIFMINLPLLILFIVLPELFLNILFGPSYIAAANSLRILAIGAFFLSILGISNRLIAMAGKSKIIFLHVIITGIVNIILNTFLIPRYGIIGAAIATSFSFILLGMLAAFKTFSDLRIIPLRRKILNAIISGGISLSLLIYLKNLVPESIISLSILSVFFVLFYVLLLFIFRGFDKNDIEILKSIFGRFDKKKPFNIAKGSICS